jgi:hypothetical protein
LSLVELDVTFFVPCAFLLFFERNLSWTTAVVSSGILTSVTSSGSVFPSAGPFVVVVFVIFFMEGTSTNIVRWGNSFPSPEPFVVGVFVVGVVVVGVFVVVVDVVATSPPCSLS